MAFCLDSRKQSKEITYSIKKNKFVICKDSVYFSLTYKQVFELHDLLGEIIKGKGEL